MSKRFGRNQKRKMRAELERLQNRVTYWADRHAMDTASLRRINNENSQALRDIAEALGVNYLGFQPYELVEEAERRGRGIDDRLFLDFGNETIEAAIVRVDAMSSKEYHRVHFTMRAMGEVSGYAISLPALYRAPEHVIAEQITRALAQHVVKAIREHR